MRVELDVSLENPLDTINLVQLKDDLTDSNKYKLLDFKLNNYLLLLNCNHFKIRVHEDGRSYIKKEISSIEELYKETLLAQMLEDLDEFLEDTNLRNKFRFKNELNFSFHGNLAHSFFWKKYEELKKIGIDLLNSTIIRTYAVENDSIYVKLASPQT